MGALVQPAPYPHTLDFAVLYWTDQWNIQAEVLLSPNSESEELNWGAYVHGLYRFPIYKEVELGPGARYGILNDGGVTTHRVTLGLAHVPRRLLGVQPLSLCSTIGPQGHLVSR
jgi:hypothetical protein